jgi:ABC-type phosphate transport system substrate-binding protein
MMRAALIVALLVAAAGVARAQQVCEDDTNVGPNRVYIQAADTQVPVLKALGAKLRAQNTPITIVYTPNGSCSNLPLLYNNTDFTSNAAGGGTFYIPAGFDGTSTPPNCTPPAVGMGKKADLGISIVFADKTDCPSLPSKPATVAITQGPVQAMVFAVPGGVGTNMGSMQTTITAEEAYLVAGLGPTRAMVAPWSDPTYFYGRTATKGTQISLGANIGVASAKWQLIADASHQIDQSTQVLTSIAAQAATGNAEKTLGILGVEIYDGARAMVHALAFRAFHQNKSYWPDSTPTTFDKQNVRDGHYPLWSYVEYVAPQAGGGGALNANAQEIIDLLVGKQVATNPAFEPLDQVIGAGLVPACAMKVQRSVEGGDLSPATIAEPCGCYFEKKATGNTSCTACTDNSTCGTGMCRHGYCEAR